MTELMDDAKKLTVRNPDGSIKVAGFVPLNEWEELGPSDLGRAWGAQWFDSNGDPQLSTDPGWTSALEWQKQLIDWYGYDNIEKFFATYTNAEFNANNAFQTGKVAMTFDGEWRTAFIARGNPKLNYDTRAVPGRRRPSRPVRLGPRRRHGGRHPQGRRAIRTRRGSS